MSAVVTCRLVRSAAAWRACSPTPRSSIAARPTRTEDEARRRHLLRLWLTAHAFTGVDEVRRAGIPKRTPG